jgi:acetolactate synthase regulatory subunit
MKLEMTVTGERCFTNLCHQLEKLHEVQHASHITTVRSHPVRKLA